MPKGDVSFTSVVSHGSIDADEDCEIAEEHNFDDECDFMASGVSSANLNSSERESARLPVQL